MKDPKYSRLNMKVSEAFRPSLADLNRGFSMQKNRHFPYLLQLGDTGFIVVVSLISLLVFLSFLFINPFQELDEKVRSIVLPMSAMLPSIAVLGFLHVWIGRLPISQGTVISSEIIEKDMIVYPYNSTILGWVIRYSAHGIYRRRVFCLRFQVEMLDGVTVTPWLDYVFNGEQDAKDFLEDFVSQGAPLKYFKALNLSWINNQKLELRPTLRPVMLNKESATKNENIGTFWHSYYRY